MVGRPPLRQKRSKKVQLFMLALGEGVERPPLIKKKVKKGPISHASIGPRSTIHKIDTPSPPPPLFKYPGYEPVFMPKLHIGRSPCKSHVENEFFRDDQT